MATRVWNDETEAEVWMVEPRLSKDDFGATDSSDTETTISSMETIESAEVADYFCVRHGRAFPMYDDLPLALPADQGEMYRLKIQHMAIKKLVGGALDSIIESQLAPSFDGRRRCVLDIRTQGGIW
ncbi:unnamed protein product [Rhizoctonia solani]|nr:unnamed protein product [Rhizoctonia solani]CAE6460598.1 unnamed protein product [Rhizoctonia solani]